MKKLLLMLILITSISFAQHKTGSLATPFATAGWDTLYGHTTYYQLPYYNLLSNPGGWININQRMVDSLFNKLVVFTDTTQLVIRNDTLRISNYSNGTGTFDTTATTDTVFVDSTFKATDNVFLQSNGTTYNVKDILYVEKKQYGFVVHRGSSGTSGLTYQWWWIKRY